MIQIEARRAIRVPIPNTDKFITFLLADFCTGVDDENKITVLYEDGTGETSVQIVSIDAAVAMLDVPFPGVDFNIILSLLDKKRPPGPDRIKPSLIIGAENLKAIEAEMKATNKPRNGKHRHN